jgi:hypothetical protein
MLKKAILKASLLAMVLGIMSAGSKTEAYMDVCSDAAHD